MKVLIFKPGEWNGVKYSRSFAMDIADRYKASKRRAPVVVGHRWDRNSDEDELAHGWVESVEANGVGNVYADITDVSDELAEWIESKQLRYVSAEFKMRRNEEREPIEPDLMAIAMLGRSCPAVAGTKVVSLSADDTEQEPAEVVSVSFEIEHIKSEKEEHMAEETKTVEMMAAEHQALESMLTEKDAELVVLRERERARESGAFADALVKAGKVTPAMKEQVTKVHSMLAGEQRTAFAAVMEGLPSQVPLGATHMATPPATDGMSARQKIVSYQQKHKIETFADAYIACATEEPAIVQQLETEDAIGGK